VTAPTGAQPVTAPTVAGAVTQRLLAVRTTDVREHEARLGPVRTPPADVLIAELDRAGLDGRGGAGFPVASKLASVLAQRPRRRRGPLVIANGAEGEPASGKDALLLRETPHLVLDGLVSVAAALGASEAVVATTADRVAGVERAVGQRRFPCPVRVQVVPHAFVTGEASAIASAVTGGIGRPMDHPVRLAERGPDGRATLVSNVETLANVALVARFGADWFRSVGSPSAPGTRLVTVSGQDGRRTVLEVAGGMPLRAVLGAGGVDPDGLRAVLVGGYGGAWVPRSALDVPFDADGLRPWAATPGAGILLALGTATCPLRATAEIASGLAGASAGRCGPCVNGLPRIADVVGALAGAPWTGGRADPRLGDEVLRVAALVDGRGACHHPDGVAKLVRSAMAVFRDDVAAHLDGTCVTVGRHA
jgi:NADH:ubiquinone oxidoreductase subunit F (NADH-binding)